MGWMCWLGTNSAGFGLFSWGKRGIGVGPLNSREWSFLFFKATILYPDLPIPIDRVIRPFSRFDHFGLCGVSLLGALFKEILL